MKLKVMNILSPVQLNNIQSRNWNSKRKKQVVDNRQQKLTLFYCKVKSTSGQEKKEENMYKNPVRINNNNYHTMMTTTTANHYQKSQLNYQNDWSSVNFLNNKPRQYMTYSNFNSHNNKNRNNFTINLTRNEPRLVIHNHEAKFHQKKSQKIRSPNKKLNSRYRLINIRVNKLKAPYNTTQYLMYDYSKRRGPLKDQQLPDEQEQFTNEWNLALNHLDDENDPSLVLLKNFFSLDTRLSETKPIDINSDRLDSQMIKLKKSLSELDLTCENELSNFLSTSI